MTTAEANAAAGRIKGILTDQIGDTSDLNEIGTTLEFYSAGAFKDYLESISEEISGVHFLLYANIHGLNFFIPMWHYRDGKKLWVLYDEEKKCHTVTDTL